MGADGERCGGKGALSVRRHYLDRNVNRGAGGFIRHHHRAGGHTGGIGSGITGSRTDIEAE